jgi:hypothetical protein
MTKVLVIGLDIEDYYGTALENIDFDNPIELDPEEINVRVDSFCVAGLYEEEEEGYILRIQYEFEDSIIKKDEVDEIHNQLMEVLLESSEDNIGNEKEVSQKILLCLEMMSK